VKVIHSVHPDTLTWTILGTFAAFWLEELLQMLRHGTTTSQLIGKFEGKSIAKHCLVALLGFILILHLAFFP